MWHTGSLVVTCDQGSNLGPLHGECRVLATGPLGKSLSSCLKGPTPYPSPLFPDHGSRAGPSFFLEARDMQLFQPVELTPAAPCLPGCLTRSKTEPTFSFSRSFLGRPEVGSHLVTLLPSPHVPPTTLLVVFLNQTLDL